MNDDLEFTLDRLADESRPVRTTNLAPLSDLPRGQIGEFRAAWTDFSPARRLELIGALVEQAEADVRLCFHTILRECLGDPDPRVRTLAIEGLWEDERPSLVGPLARLLAEDQAPAVRAAAAIALGRFVLLGVLGDIAPAPAGQAEQALRAAWSCPGEALEVRRRALEGLAVTDADDVAELIDLAYHDEDKLMRQSAVYAMGRSGDPRWSKVVLVELNSQDAAMRFEAANAAGELELPSTVKPLIRLLSDPDSNVREAAALALGQIGGIEARRALEACLRHAPDERLVQAADEALQELVFNSGSLATALFDFGPPLAEDWSDLDEESVGEEDDAEFELYGDLDDEDDMDEEMDFDEDDLELDADAERELDFDEDDDLDFAEDDDLDLDA
jgi:hypothetical protein